MIKFGQNILKVMAEVDQASIEEVSAEINRKERPERITVLACKECGFAISSINNHLCGGARVGSQWIKCKYDGIDIGQRPAGSLEVRIYKLDSLGKYEGGRYFGF